jgi:hypothetical protein
MCNEKNPMKGQEHIEKIREYLCYLEDHLNNVHRAFIELSEICKDMVWVADDFTWHTIRIEVEYHDLSKFSQEEFIPYQEKFFPVHGHYENNNKFKKAWEHHKNKNHHHHETVETYLDIIHMIIDWTAMGYKYGDTAQKYYESNKDKIKLSDDHIKFMYEIFHRQNKTRNI